MREVFQKIIVFTVRLSRFPCPNQKNVFWVHDAHTRLPTETDAFMIFLPLLIVLSTLLFVLLLFLIFVLFLRHRRGISLRDYEGPIDVSREDNLEAEGGLAGLEDRWLESVQEDLRRTYRQGKREYSYTSS